MDAPQKWNFESNEYCWKLSWYGNTPGVAFVPPTILLCPRRWYGRPRGAAGGKENRAYGIACPEVGWGCRRLKLKGSTSKLQLLCPRRLKR